MKDVSGTRHLSRRGFLRLAGLAAGGLMAESVLGPAPLAHASGLGAAPGPGALAPVGVLLPATTVYPDLGRNFLSGLQLAVDGSLVIVARETSAGRKNPYETAQQLIGREGVRSLVGMIDPLALAALRGTLAAHQATALAVSLGENLERVNPADSRVTYHSLDLVPAAVAFGGWAARSLGRRAVLAASCYDSGYDAFAAFRLGFQNAGGQVLHTAITHLPTDGPDLAAVMREIAGLRPDFVFASYCGPAALDWLRAYQAAGLAGSLPLAGGPFLTDETLLAAAGEAALGITTAAPATDAPGLACAGSSKVRTGRPADLFALLGYETGRILTGQPWAAGRLMYGPCSGRPVAW